MDRLLYNADRQVRIVWRLLSFILVVMVMKIAQDTALQALLPAGLLRGILSRLGYVFATLVSLTLQVRYIDRSSYEKYGFSQGRAWMADFTFGCAVALIQLSLYFALMRGTGDLEIVGYLTSGAPEHTFAQGFLAELPRQLTVAVSEEILFRAVLFYGAYEALRRLGKAPGISAMAACVGVSYLFGAVHLANEGATLWAAFNLGFDGVVISLPFLLTGRLGASIGMHFAWNLLQGAVFGLPNSGMMAKASILGVSLADNAWTGGSFGPEGSILLIVLDGLAVALILAWCRRRGHIAWLHPRIAAVGAARGGGGQGGRI